MFILRLILISIWTFYAWEMGQYPSHELNGFGRFAASSFFLFAPVLYFLPTIEAAIRKRINLAQIFIINLLAGWIFVGWVIAYAMALSTKQKDVVSREPRQPEQQEIIPETVKPTPFLADELMKLYKMKDDGLLTQDELEAAKASLLGRGAGSRVEGLEK